LNVLGEGAFPWLAELQRWLSTDSGIEHRFGALLFLVAALLSISGQQKASDEE
jgi:hypothetical protein